LYRELAQLRRASVLDAPARPDAVAEVSARWRGPGAVQVIRAQKG